MGEILGGILVIIGLFITVAARDIESKLLKKKAAAAAAAAATGGGDGEEASLPTNSKNSPKDYGGTRRASNEPLIASNGGEDDE